MVKVDDLALRADCDQTVRELFHELRSDIIAQPSRDEALRLTDHKIRSRLHYTFSSSGDPEDLLQAIRDEPGACQKCLLT